MTPSKILFYLSILFVVGIFFESLIKIPQVTLWIFLFLGVALIVFSLFAFSQISIRFVDLHFVLILGFCIMLFVLGVLRMQISEFNVANNELSKLNDSSEKITLSGTIIAEPDIRESSQKLKVRVRSNVTGNVTGNVTPNVTVGTVLITTNRYPEYSYLDNVSITGKLETPAEFDDFNYKNYLMKDGIYSVINFPKIELVSKKHNYNVFSYLYEKILFSKQKLRESIRNNFSPPQSYILEGTILGDKKAIPQDFKNKMSVTGLSHIIAVSGMHVVILSSIIMFLLIGLGLRRDQAFYIAVIFICFYIILAGLPPSGIRAGIMGTVYLFAQKIGRQSVSSRIIVLACGLMLLFNPLLLFYDVGFQLSFLAVLGIIYFEPLIRKFFKFLVKFFYTKVAGGNLKTYLPAIREKNESLFSMLSVTIAAQIFTLPIIVFNFGNISWVSPITNILILPAVSFLMLFGFLSSTIGIFSRALGWVSSIPCHVLLNYFIWVVDLFSKSWMHKTIENVSWIWLVVSYFTIGFATRFLYSSRLNKFF